MEERDKKKMDQLKKKLHTDDEGLIYAFSICTGRKQFVIIIIIIIKTYLYRIAASVLRKNCYQCRSYKK